MHANDHNALEKYINDDVSGTHFIYCTFARIVDNSDNFSPFLPPFLSISCAYIMCMAIFVLLLIKA